MNSTEKSSSPYFTNIVGSDMYPYETVETVSEKTVKVRSMRCSLNPEWKPDIIVGGFVGHCVNQNSQQWIYHSDPDATVLQLRRKKHPIKRKVFNNETMKFDTVVKYEWTHKGRRFVESENPVRFHDFNF